MLVRDPEPALWALEQHYRGPDGERERVAASSRASASRSTGRGASARTSAPTPGRSEDRLRLTRATRANLSPIFALYSDPHGAASAPCAGADRSAPWGEVTDADGTRPPPLALRRPGRDRRRLARALAGAELLIADGHHRYETARVYAEEIGGEGEHRYVLMLPGRARGPRARRSCRRTAWCRGLRAAPRVALQRRDRARLRRRPTRASLAPAPGQRAARSWATSTRERRCALTPARPGDRRPRARRDAGAPTARLDTGVLEALMLKGALGLSDDDISHLHGLGYARDVEQAIAAGRLGRLRRRLPHAPDARRAGPRDRRGRREHAAEVDLLLPEDADRAAVQPAGVARVYHRLVKRNCRSPPAA